MVIRELPLQHQWAALLSEPRPRQCGVNSPKSGLFGHVISRLFLRDAGVA